MTRSPAAPPPPASDSSRRRRRLLWSLAGVFVVAALGISLAWSLDTGRPAVSSAASTGPATQVRDEPAPPLTGTTFDGSQFDLRSLRGQVVIVNVWASWCEPCKTELPLLAEAAQRWSDQDVRLVGVNMRDSVDAASTLVSESGATHMTNVSDADGTIGVQWGVRGVPETFVVDRDGRVRLRAMGAVTEDWLEQHIPPLLKT